MIDFKNQLLKPEKAASSSTPVIEVVIDTKELRKEMMVDNNVALFELLSQKEDNSFVTMIFKSLNQQIKDNDSTDDLEIKAVIDEIKSADRITYQEWPCGSCGDTGGGTRWKQVCQNGHCWCPRC